MKPEVTGVDVPPEDVDAITAIVAELQRAQQNALPDPFMNLFHRDAIWTTGHGKLLVGADEIGAFTRRVLPPAREQPVTADFEVEHILFIRPDVAAVKIRQLPVTRDGRRLDETVDTSDPEAAVANNPDAIPGTPMHILAKEDGVWRITAAQNTKVIDPETFARWSRDRA
ncbi:uncharacterized protein (TIGR02246 family) [Lipingzhangella halophila]|uniref:Uncharacterized protein (TIGR02246 family) n=1 Tax=Lipingzhangella halophila TaxID=1783352 RepID=A0A7W7RLP3_9ACTN|nr:SgcJ/EcaC family oxidoreductase [Lipingzhangella halophila]MBB4934295.1 uncharacterized protein (TIGR02246 family) [Lipingzhangella halophila]